VSNVTEYLQVITSTLVIGRYVRRLIVIPVFRIFVFAADLSIKINPG